MYVNVYLALKLQSVTHISPVPQWLRLLFSSPLLVMRGTARS